MNWKWRVAGWEFWFFGFGDWQHAVMVLPLRWARRETGAGVYVVTKEGPWCAVFKCTVHGIDLSFSSLQQNRTTKGGGGDGGSYILACLSLLSIDIHWCCWCHIKCSSVILGNKRPCRDNKEMFFFLRCVKKENKTVIRFFWDSVSLCLFFYFCKWWFRNNL